MDACAPSLYRPFALSASGLCPEAQRPQLRPSLLCGAQFTSVAGFRVDSPWISPQTATVWTGHG
jgi:hypothetical protein